MSKHHISLKIKSKKIIDCALDNAQFWVGNTKYFSHKDIFRILLLAAIENSSVEDIADYHRNILKNEIPSQDTIMKSVHENYADLSVENIQDQIVHNFQIIVKSMPQYKFKRSKVDLAIDLHDEYYFGKDIFDASGRQITMVGHNKQLGKTRKVFRTATITIVKWGNRLIYPITIGFIVNYKGQPREDLVKQLMEQIAPLKLRVGNILMDGGLASREVFEYLSLQSVNFIARGRISKKKKYEGKVDGPGFEYSMIRPGEEDYRVYANLLSVKHPRDENKKIILLSSRSIKSKEVRKLYKMRFRIENTYRHSKVNKIRTSTRKPHLRWVFWAISLFLELIWEITRSDPYFVRKYNYNFRQKMVNRQIHDFIMDNLASAKLIFE